MIPIVCRKSSTGIPLSTLMFLKSCSDRRGACCAGACAPANAALISPTTTIPPAASIPRLNQSRTLCPLKVIYCVPFCWEVENSARYYSPLLFQHKFDDERAALTVAALYEP